MLFIVRWSQARVAAQVRAIHLVRSKCGLALGTSNMPTRSDCLLSNGIDLTQDFAEIYLRAGTVANGPQLRALPTMLPMAGSLVNCRSLLPC